VGADALPWSALDGVDAVYFTAGDVDALRAARRAQRLVASIRARETLAAAGVEVDVLVSSANDAGERYERGELDPAPGAVVRTAGAAGGALELADGTTTHWAAAALPGPPVDSYGAGDSFAAGLTYGLATGRSAADALELAARCGARSITGRGPYGARLAADRL
jgi:ribokinase